MKIIGIIAQKGGQGKSFICSLFSKLATGNKKKVLIIDGDYPQHTIHKLRDDENEFLNKNEESNFAKKVKKYVESKGYVEIIKSTPENFENTINEVKENYDYIFIDFTGSLNVAGFEIRIFKFINIVIVPTRVDSDDIRSNFEFCFSFLKPLSKTYDFNFYVIFNQVENVKGGDLAKVANFRDFLASQKMNCFEHFILKRKAFAKHIYKEKNGESSTILLPKMDKNLMDLVEEFNQKIL